MGRARLLRARPNGSTSSGNKPAFGPLESVSGTPTDAGIQAVIREWIGLWFDGAPHNLGGLSVAVPVAQVGFDRFDLPQPITVVGITFVSRAHGEGRRYSMPGGSRWFMAPSWSVYLRASGCADESGNAASRCRTAGGLPHA